MDFNTLTLERLRQASEHIKPPEYDRGKSYLNSYPSILAHFKTLRESAINRDQFIVACHIVYGWMPKVLTIHERYVDSAVAALNKAREGESLDVADLEALKKAVNNSMVGVSKLLHFLDPETYAIWDSKVCSYILGRKAYTQVNNPEYYLAYLNRIRELTQEADYPEIHEKVRAMVGYSITKLRSIEVVMFYGSGQEE